jgi:hypothetical protein
MILPVANHSYKIVIITQVCIIEVTKRVFQKGHIHNNAHDKMVQIYIKNIKKKINLEMSET